MNNEKYFQELRKRVAKVDGFYIEFPWLWGALGNPNSKIIFIALAPSLTQVKQIHHEAMTGRMEEAQWFASKGDEVFRKCLVRSEFKLGTWDSIGDWKCYITNFVKKPYYANQFRNLTSSEKKLISLPWLKIIKWEISTISPKIIVSLGDEVYKFLSKINLDNIPIVKIYQYSYIAFKPDNINHLPAMDQQRITEYCESIASLRKYL